MGSFSEIIESEAERLINCVTEENSHIKNFEEFETAFRNKWNTPKGENAMISPQDIVDLWNTKECKAMIRDNVGDKKYDDLYGDGILVKREVIGTKIITITEPKISVKSYTRNGRKVKAYSKGYHKWKPLEVKFLSIRKAQKKLTTQQIIAEYNKHFRKNPKSSSSIKTKIFRI